MNKVNTKVTLRFDVENSPTLSHRQKQLILERLGNRLSRDGVLLVVASEHRTQKGNRDAALLRLTRLIQGALTVRKPRKATGPTRASKERRLNTKRKRSAVKSQRKRVTDE